MRFEAPRLGGSFAVWGGLFSAFDCTLVAVRKKVCAAPPSLRFFARLSAAAPSPARAPSRLRSTARRKTRGTRLRRAR